MKLSSSPSLDSNNHLFIKAAHWSWDWKKMIRREAVFQMFL